MPFVATEHRNTILKAMQTMMYAVGTPIPGKSSRKTCIYFRPKQSQDKTYVQIGYGKGCSSTVRNENHCESFSEKNHSHPSLGRLLG